MSIKRQHFQKGSDKFTISYLQFVRSVIFDIIFIEEMEKEFVIPIISKDGRQINMQVRQKNGQLMKRKVKTWTSEEDAQLLDLYQQFPKKWSQIALLMTDRNQNQCLHRYRRLAQLGKSHKIWSSQEDQTILKLLRKYGKNWKLISEMLGTKNGKQIRQRYINKLDPRIKREDWSEEEDKQILQLYSKVGSKWSQISKSLVGRPQNKVKNRFYSYIQKNYDIKFKEVQNIDPQITLNDAPKKLQKFELKPAYQAQHQKKVERFLQDQNINVQEGRVCSKDQIPSINEIDLWMKNQMNFSNNLLESVLRADEEWRLGNNYQSILQLRSAQFISKISN